MLDNPEIIYNGVSSEDVGVIVTRLPDFHRAARRVTQVDIPGRSRPVYKDEGGYDCYQTDLEINCNGVELRTIYEWLRGEGWMISSDEEEMMAYVYLYGQITDERFRVEETCYDSIKLTMTVEPYRREVRERAVSLSAPGTFRGRGSDAALPKITLTGSGDITLTVNDTSLLIDGLSGSITIDSDAGAVYTGEGSTLTWAGEMVTLQDDWPALKPAGGTNAVSWTGSVTGVVIQPQWRYL